MSDAIRIAVVDDGSTQVDRIVDILTREGVEVLVRHADPDVVVETVDGERADVVILVATELDQVGSLVRTRAAPATSPLSPREGEILDLLAAGVHVAAIARRLGISLHTARGHVKKILAKLGCHSQLEAVAKGNAEGWIRPVER